MANIRQLGLLIWKNYVLQKRKVFLTILEIALPTFFAVILIFIRQRVEATFVPKVTNWTDCDITSFPFNLIDQFPNASAKLAYYPDIPIIERLIENMERKLPKRLIKGQGFNDEDEMAQFLLVSNSTMNNTRDYIGGIVFDSKFNETEAFFPSNITFKIRLSSAPRNAGKQGFKINPFATDTRWNTNFMFPVFQKIGPREKNDVCGGAPGYYREGFLALQHAASLAVMDEIAAADNLTVPPLEMTLRRNPYPPYNDDNFVLVIQQQFPLVIMLSFVLFALSIVKDVVHEKERKLKESMKMMGLSSWLHWTAWFLKYLVFLSLSIALMTLFYSVPVGSKGAVVGNTNFVLLFLFLLCYGIATISFCFCISTFFSKANSAAAAGGIIFFLSYVPYFFLQPRYNTLSWWAKILTSLIHNVGMAYGGQVIGMFEGTGAGVQWNNFYKGVSVDDDFALLHVMVVLLVDAVLYGIITWYVEVVFPGDYGVPQPWYFPVLKSYWCGTLASYDLEDDENCISQDPSSFESSPVGLNCGIRIRSLRKVFPKKKVAVSGMNLDIYEGQITALLGHNGAGKTTTMSMLTGFIPPSSGTAIVNGHDIRRDIAGVRSSLGLCPQHDVLFDSLTVEEHLYFFSKLKGLASKSVPAAIDAMLLSIGLKGKRHAQAKTLSGGMKRKLSVGIALIGDSKIIILDEPSSGMDPDARRHIWSVLQSHRAGRTMLLSTHFMDEADTLGDRIAIMADGALQCCGSSLFLKNKYGAGYHMVIVKDKECDVSRITQTVQHYIPQALMESNVGAQLSYILPQESSNAFEGLFTDIQKNKTVLGIASYGASVTTMEEVFIRVGEYSETSIRKNVETAVAGPSSSMEYSQNTYTSSSSNLMDYEQSGIIFRNTGSILYTQQFFAMCLKRILHTWRNKVVSVSQLAVPLFFTIMAIIVVKTFPGPQDSIPLQLRIDGFEKNFVAYAVDRDSPNDSFDLGKYYIKQLDGSTAKTVFVNDLPEYRDGPSIYEYLVDEGEKSLATYNSRYMIAAQFGYGESSVGTVDSAKPEFTVNNVTLTMLLQKAGVTGNKLDSIMKYISQHKEKTAHLSAVDGNVTKAKTYYNNQAFHTPAIALSVLANATLKFISRNENYSMMAVNHPLPRTIANKVNDDRMSGTGFTIAFNVLFGMSFLASSFVLFIVKERATKAKHIQFVSGVHSINFWMSTFLWDLVNFMIPCLCLVITFWAFDIKAYVVDYHFLLILLLFFLYAFAMLPFMYLWSFLFTVPSSSLVWLTMFNMLSGVATILAVGILDIPQLGTQDISHALEWTFLTFLPNFCLGQGLEDFYSNYEFSEVCHQFNLTEICAFPFPFPCCKGHCGDICLDFNDDYLGWSDNGIGRMVIFLVIQGLFYWMLVLVIESGIIWTLWYRYGCNGTVIKPQPGLVRQMSSGEPVVQEDNDVATERARLANNTLGVLMQTDTLILQDLCKYYGNNLAVDHISIGITKGECFGLLGINGAGKTTTFKMMTGDEMLSGGTAFLGGKDVRLNIKEVQQQLGYCPQFDALIDQMTGRETLYMYARLRGVHEGLIRKVVQRLMDSLTLTQYADQLAGTYSGGNKRKLSTAIALVGDPPIVFLDEPTTGMDPVARRLLWDVLVKVRDSGRTLVLTSHSMEECEALCTRLAIMVNGQFKCLGSPQHLKNKFGEGYTLIVRIGHPPGRELDLEPITRFIDERFPGSVLKDVHQGTLNYHIQNTSLSWAEVFGTLERAKVEYNIEDYLVSQTTLEQVFINFARAQIPPHETKTSCFKSCRRFFCPCCSSHVEGFEVADLE